MDNFKLSAHPQPIAFHPITMYLKLQKGTIQSGFTKLELASLMIAQGAIGEIAHGVVNDNFIPTFVSTCVKIAKSST